MLVHQKGRRSVHSDMACVLALPQGHHTSTCFSYNSTPCRLLQHTTTKDAQAAAMALKKAAVPLPGSMAIFVKCKSPIWTSFLTQAVEQGIIGSSDFNFRVYLESTELWSESSVTDLVDVEILPRSIGGKASSFSEDGTVDPTCCHGVQHPSFTTFVEQLQFVA